ncbi:MAG: stage II sporulation protein M [Thermacetogeniaceae bacterium]
MQKLFLSKLRLWISQHREIFFPVVLMIAAFLAGLVCGALAIRTLSAEELRGLQDCLNRFLQEIKPFYEASNVIGFQGWYRILSVQLPVMGFLWILGLTVVGIPLIILTVGLRGFILGFTIGFLVKDQSLRGLLLAMAAVLPQNLCYVPALLGAGSIAFYFSLSLAQGHQGGSIIKGIIFYTFLFALVLMVTIVGTWVEACFVPSLVRFVVSLT